LLSSCTPRRTLTVHEQSAAGLTDPRNQRLGEVMLALTILLALMASVNLRQSGPGRCRASG
jgi:hypothetical protein